jgi:hypothetical protein
MTSPYESPSVAGSVLDAPSALKWACLLAWFYPVSLVAAIYGTWMVAFFELGHIPRPSLDDPRQLGTALHIPYAIAGLLLTAFPVAAVAGVILQLSMPRRTWSRRFISTAFFVTYWVVIIVFLRWDPMHVAEWLMD